MADQVYMLHGRRCRIVGSAQVERNAQRRWGTYQRLRVAFDDGGREQMLNGGEFYPHALPVVQVGSTFNVAGHGGVNEGVVLQAYALPGGRALVLQGWRRLTGEQRGTIWNEHWMVQQKCTAEAAAPAGLQVAVNAGGGAVWIRNMPGMGAWAWFVFDDYHACRMVPAGEPVRVYKVPAARRVAEQPAAAKA